MKPNTDHIFDIKNNAEFNELALAVFRFQASENKVYRKYLNTLKITVDSIAEIEDIPFLPVEFFKTHTIITGSNNKNPEYRLFTSSGTTGTVQSKHHVNDVRIYEKSFSKGFEYFYGNIQNYCILALLPSYLEREGSSLIYMADDLIKRSNHPESGFYLHNYEELTKKLKHLESIGQKIILLGVTYALLDIIEQFPLFKKEQGGLKNTIIMETGGMKGKRREMIREELHDILCKGFGVDLIHSEYGMTELLSQAYSKGNGIFNCPPWMKILIRDTNDPFTFLPHGRSGGINIIDLANINSCSFIATQDLGKKFSNDSFEVLGRFDNGDIRGCNLLVQ